MTTETQPTRLAQEWRPFFLATIVISILLFVFLAFSVKMDLLFESLDQRLFVGFADLQEQAPGWFNTAARWFQNLTSTGMAAVTAILVIYWWVKDRKRWSLLVLASAGGAHLLWYVLIFTIDRSRPNPVNLWEFVGGMQLQLPSFPSGHTMFNVAFFGALLYILFLRVASTTARVAFFLFSVLVVVLIGLNRLYFSVHYMTDVLGGYLAGIAWAAIALWLVEWGLKRRRA